MQNEELNFPGIREGEIIQEWVHKHWIVHIRTLISILIFGLGLTAVMGVIFRFTLGGTDFFNHSLLLLIFYLNFIWLWAFVRWIDEEFDSIIVTTDRVLDITQDGLFKIIQSETSLDLIQDVRGTKSGILGNILSYGELEAQTAASSIVLEMDHVPYPTIIAQRIQNCRAEFLIRHGRKEEANTGRETEGMM